MLLYRPTLSRFFYAAKKSVPLIFCLLLVALLYLVLIALLGGSNPFVINGSPVSFTLGSSLKHMLSVFVPLGKNSISLTEEMPLELGYFLPIVFKFLISFPSLVWIGVQASADISPIIGLQCKAIQIRPAQGIDRNHESVRQWTSLENEVRRADYQKLFTRLKQNMPKNVLDDSDLPQHANYTLVIVFSRRWLFWGEVAAHASCRYYSDSAAIRNEIPDDILNRNLARQVEEGECTLVDRLSIDVTKSPTFASGIKNYKRSVFNQMLLAEMCKKIIVNCGASTVLGLARCDGSDERLLMRYAPMGPSILGKVTYELGHTKLDFWAFAFEREAARAVIRSQICTLTEVSKAL